MDKGAYLTPFVPLFLLVLGIVYFQKLRWKRRKARGKRNPGFCPNIVALGIALQILQTLCEPQTDYVLEEREKDDADEDADGDEDDSDRFLQQQLRRIRRGERLDSLAIRSAAKKRAAGKADS